jgi:hypothetical protein
MKRRDLIETLAAVGKPTETWESTDGSQALILPYGGRILGLFAPGDDENFFWTTRALADHASTKAFYHGTQWHNSGGDRTWLAPEVDFFFPQFPNLDTYFQQRALDPGNYKISRHDGTLTLTNRATLSMSRTGQQVQVEITKSLQPALNPLRYEQTSTAGVAFAGFTLVSTLQLLGTYPSQGIGLWRLTQLPHRGEMLVPTFFRSEPKIYMGCISSPDLKIGDHLVRYKMQAKGEHKLGIRAAALTGRTGYLYRCGEHTSLVAHNFFVNPSAEYVDVPWTETSDFGYAFQACNIDNDLLHLGEFSEMEYHMPAIGGTTGKTFSEDRAQLWAFRGPQEKIKAIVRHLLSPEF